MPRSGGTEAVRLLEVRMYECMYRRSHCQANSLTLAASTIAGQKTSELSRHAPEHCFFRFGSPQFDEFSGLGLHESAKKTSTVQ